jgi:hypothetical protein
MSEASLDAHLLERCSQRLLSECRIVDSVIDTLAAHGATRR